MRFRAADQKRGWDHRPCFQKLASSKKTLRKQRRFLALVNQFLAMVNYDTLLWEWMRKKTSQKPQNSVPKAFKHR